MRVCSTRRSNSSTAGCSNGKSDAGRCTTSDCHPFASHAAGNTYCFSRTAPRYRQSISRPSSRGHDRHGGRTTCAGRVRDISTISSAGVNSIRGRRGDIDAIFTRPRRHDADAMPKSRRNSNSVTGRSTATYCNTGSGNAAGNLQSPACTITCEDNAQLPYAVGPQYWPHV